MERKLEFENFYIHGGNEVAYLATQKIIESPGELFNPFYVYGGAGLGKTHLLRALHSELSKKLSIQFFSTKDFERHILDTERKYTSFIIDDLHTISKKYHEIIAEIITKSLEQKNQICLSGDVAPRDIENLDAKLISLFEGGLVCDLQAPKDIVLVDMIKKKSEEFGITLTDDVVLELGRICEGSMRILEEMLDCLKEYAVPGDVPLDIHNVRSRLKEFYPKGVYSPVSSLLSEFKKTAPNVLKDVSKKLNIREEYKEKIYIWEMKGFDTSSLKQVLDDDITVLKRSYDTFIQRVNRLAELQKEFSSLDTTDFPDEAMRIESMLFSPKDVEGCEKLLMHIKKGVKKKEPDKVFGSFILGNSNRNVYEIYKNQILKSLGEKLNPFIILGKKGTGKTHFLEMVNRDLKSQNRSVLFFDLAEEKEVPRENGEDVLMIDNFHRVFSASKDRRSEIFKLILRYVKGDKEIVIGSDIFPVNVALSEEEKIIFELGLEVKLAAPSYDVVTEYIRSQLPRDKAEEVIKRGLPSFTSFYEMDDFLDSFSAEPPAEVVPLGFPDETIPEQQELQKEETVVKDEKDLGEKELILKTQKPSNMIREERYIFPEVIDELIEESY